MRMMITCCIALMLVMTGLHAQPAVEWSQVYGGADFESMWNLIPVQGGRYLIVGETRTYGAGAGDFWIVMVDANGQTIWTRTLGGPDYDVCTYCTQTSDGGFAAVGQLGATPADSTGESWLIKLNANGDSVWSRVLGVPDKDDLFYWVEQTADGGYILAGTVQVEGYYDYDGRLVKVDAGGAIQWERTYGGASDDEFISVALASDGGYAMSGVTDGFGAGGYDGWLLKVDATGDSLWSQTYGGVDNDYLYALQRTADNGYFIVGASHHNAVNANWLTVKTDDLGNAEWIRELGDFGYDAAWQGQELGDGSFIVGGYYEYADSGSTDLAATKLAANGDSVWTLRFFGDGADLGWFAYATPDGGFLLGADTYSSWSAGNADWLVVKTESECDDATPQTPDVVITQTGSDVVLHWDPVTQSVTNCPIEASHYLVFYSPTFAGPYYYHGYTVNTDYTHLGVVAYAPAWYYHVVASTSPIPTLLSQPPAGTSLTESAALELLRDHAQMQRLPMRKESLVGDPAARTDAPQSLHPLDRLRRR